MFRSIFPFGVGDLVYILKTGEYYIDLLFRCFYILEFAYDLQNIMVNVCGFAGVYYHRAVLRHMIQRKQDAGLIKEGYFLRQFQADGIAAMILLFTEEVRAFHVTPQDKHYAYSHTQCNTDQQVGEYDSYNRHHEGDPLVFAFAEHFFEDGNLT